MMIGNGKTVNGESCDCAHVAAWLQKKAGLERARLKVLAT
jgi:hypothetical protein